MTKAQQSRLNDFYAIPILGRADSYVRGHYVDRYGFMHVYTGYDHINMRTDRKTGELAPYKTGETVLHSVINQAGNLVVQCTYPDSPAGYWRINKPYRVELTPKNQKLADLSDRYAKTGIIPDNI